MYNHWYQYDNTNDNLTYKCGVTLTYGDDDHPHAVASTGDGWAFTYDAIGNQITRSDVSSSVALTYDAESRLIGASGDVTAGFLYNGDGNRVLSTISGVTTVYVGDHYEIEIGSQDTTRLYYTANGSRLAMRVEGTLYWLLGDHLGSTTRTLSGTGYELAELRYKTFGETRYSAGETPTAFRYTGQREEAELGLYYYRARWYDPMVGRFVSADTIVPGVGNPQAWNRYGYVNNNPLKFTDPSGHHECEYFDYCESPFHRYIKPEQESDTSASQEIAEETLSEQLQLPSTITIPFIEPSNTSGGFYDPELEALLWWWDSVVVPFNDFMEAYDLYRLHSKGGYRIFRYTLPLGPAEGVVAAVDQWKKDTWYEGLTTGQRIARPAAVGLETIATDVAATLAGGTGALAGTLCGPGEPICSAVGLFGSSALVTAAGDRFWANVNPFIFEKFNLGVYP